MRFSLRTQLLFAAGVSVVCACLVYPDPIVGDLFYTAAMLLIAFGTIAAIYYRGQRRAFLIGFLILFGGYFYFTAMPSEMRLSWMYFQQGGGVRSASPGFITTRLLASAYEGLNPDVLTGRQPISGRPSMPRTTEQNYGRYLGFLVIGHSVIALGLGIAGGSIAQWLALRTPPVAGRPIDQILDEMDRQ